MVFSKAGARKGKECSTCGEEVEFISQSLPVCLDCLRSGKESIKLFTEEAHRRSRGPFQLANIPPRNRSGISCQICVNQCHISEGEWGYCGLRTQKEGALQGVSSENGNVSWYYDGLPTNCVADWVCPGGTGAGYPQFAYTPDPEYGYKNLAVFYHGCSFDCLFCQNWTHRERVRDKKRVTPEELTQAVDDRTSCICFFWRGSHPTTSPRHQGFSKVYREGKGQDPSNLLGDKWIHEPRPFESDGGSLCELGGMHQI